MAEPPESTELQYRASSIEYPASRIKHPASSILRFGISDCGFNGKAHGAEGIAFDFSEISELSTCTLCAMRYRIQHPVTSIQHPVTSDQLPVTSIQHRVSSNEMPVTRSQ
jgi:hypothetical protein